MKAAAKRAFRRLAKLYHPDCGGDELVFKELVRNLQNVLESDCDDARGQDILVVYELSERDVESLKQGGLRFTVTTRRTQPLGQVEEREHEVNLSLEEFDQVVVLEGLGEEGYPDGNLVFLFKNVFEREDGLYVRLRGRSESEQAYCYRLR